MPRPFVRPRLRALTSLHWDTLWRIAEWSAQRRAAPDGPVLRYDNGRYSSVRGNLSAALELVEWGLARIPPAVVDEMHARPSAEPVQATSRGRSALRSAAAARHRIRPRLEEGTLELRIPWETEDWTPFESDYETIWRIAHDGPIALTPEDIAGERLAGRNPSGSIGYYRDLVTRGVAELLGDSVAITAAGRAVLAGRPDLPLRFEGLRKVHREHKNVEPDADDHVKYAVPKGCGLVRCSCGWFLGYEAPSSRQWADENPSGGHLQQMLDIATLHVARERAASQR